MPLTPEEEAQLAAEEAAGLFDHDEPGGGSASGTLELPASPESVAYSRFVDLVRSALEDHPVEVAVRSWSGRDGDDTVPDAPPWIRFSPSGGKPTPYAMGILATPVTVHVDMMTGGLAVADNFNLWAVLDAAIRSPEFQAAMREAGAAEVRPIEAAAGVRPNVPKYEPTREGSIFAAGTIEIRIYRRV